MPYLFKLLEYCPCAVSKKQVPCFVALQQSESVFIKFLNISFLIPATGLCLTAIGLVPCPNAIAQTDAASPPGQPQPFELRPDSWMCSKLCCYDIDMRTVRLLAHRNHAEIVQQRQQQQSAVAPVDTANTSAPSLTDADAASKPKEYSKGSAAILRAEVDALLRQPPPPLPSVTEASSAEKQEAEASDYSSCMLFRSSGLCLATMRDLAWAFPILRQPWMTCCPGSLHAWYPQDAKTQIDQLRLNAEDEQKKSKGRKKGRIRELEEIRAELAEKELVLLGRERELLEKEQTVTVLREEVIFLLDCMNSLATSYKRSIIIKPALGTWINVEMVLAEIVELISLANPLAL
jgi:hypothetical protein